VHIEEPSPLALAVFEPLVEPPLDDLTIWIPDPAAGPTPTYRLKTLHWTPTRQEYAIWRSLQWLARVQDPQTGAWSLSGTQERSMFPDGSPHENTSAATALALLAFQAIGHTPSKGKHKEQVTQGWAYLLKRQKPDGSFPDADGRDPLRTHALCTFALCQIYHLTRDPQFQEPATRAIAWSVKTQHPTGGWGLSTGPDGTSVEPDTTTTGWMTMALESARLARIEVPKEAWDGVARYLDAAELAGGRRYRDVIDPTSPVTETATAAGLLCRQYLGWQPNDPRLKSGAKTLIATRPPAWSDRDVTYWYFATPAMQPLDGDAWRVWSASFRDLMVEEQYKTGPEKGTWDPLLPDPDAAGVEGGRLYVTCLSTCILAVYCRHVPAEVLFR
jgi:hypothetical protein